MLHLLWQEGGVSNEDVALGASFCGWKRPEQTSAELSSFPEYVKVNSPIVKWALPHSWGLSPYQWSPWTIYTYQYKIRVRKMRDHPEVG